MALFLQTEGTVTPCCSKSHIAYMLYLPKLSSKININFMYEPKYLEDKNASKEMIYKAFEKYVLEENRQQYLENWDAFLPLNNLITLSFDDVSGFRGCAHRHDHHQQLVISEHGASPGLIPGPVPPGQFRITLSVHAVVTDSCRYRLKVWEGDEIFDPVDAF